MAEFGDVSQLTFEIQLNLGVSGSFNFPVHCASLVHWWPWHGQAGNTNIYYIHVYTKLVILDYSSSTKSEAERQYGVWNTEGRMNNFLKRQK